MPYCTFYGRFIQRLHRLNIEGTFGASHNIQYLMKDNDPEIEVEEPAELDGNPALEPEVLDDNEPASDDGRYLPALATSDALVPLDPLTSYLNEIRQYPELSETEEHELAIHYKDTGDVKAAYRLITHNLLLVVKIAMGFKREWQSMMDLVQEGNVGLMKAVQNFDPFRGVRLPAYASFWIKAYILKYILDNWRLVRVGTTNTRRKLLYNLRKEKERLEEQGFEATPQKLAEHFGVDEQEVIDVQASLGASDVSIDTPAHPDQPISAPLKKLTDGQNHAHAVEIEQFHQEFRKNIDEFLENLKPIEKELFATRILSDDPTSLKDIGKNYNITREAVRQAEQRLLKKFKMYLAEAMPEAKDYFKN